MAESPENTDNITENKQNPAENLLDNNPTVIKEDANSSPTYSSYTNANQALTQNSNTQSDKITEETTSSSDNNLSVNKTAKTPINQIDSLSTQTVISNQNIDNTQSTAKGTNVNNVPLEKNRAYPHVVSEEFTRLSKRLSIGFIVLIASLFICEIPLSIVSFYIGYSTRKRINSAHINEPHNTMLLNKSRIILVMSIVSLVLNIVTFYQYMQYMPEFFSNMDPNMLFNSQNPFESSSSSNSIWG